jgi:cytochrome c553
MLIRKPMMIAMIALLSTTGGVQAAGNAERGQDLIYDCIECHGTDGKGDFETPDITGLKEAYLLKQLRDFYSRKRDSLDDMMHLYTEDRTDQDLQDLAAYWATVK